MYSDRSIPIKTTEPARGECVLCGRAFLPPEDKKTRPRRRRKLRGREERMRKEKKPSQTGGYFMVKDTRLSVSAMRVMMVAISARVMEFQGRKLLLRPPVRTPARYSRYTEGA